MKVKELIEKLFEFDENMEVLIYSYDDLGSSLCSPDEVKVELCTTKLSNQYDVPHTEENCLTIGSKQE